MALKKLCRCGKLIDYSQRYCNDCKPKAKQEKAERHKYYDTYKRDKRAAAFYNSTEWEKTRDYVIAKYKGLDLYAFFIDKKIVCADTVHHVEELKENWDRRLDITNLIPLSSANHTKIHEMYKKDKKNTQEMLVALLGRWRKDY